MMPSAPGRLFAETFRQMMTHQARQSVVAAAGGLRHDEAYWLGGEFLHVCSALREAGHRYEAHQKN
jgi:deoxyhypusine synthase